MREALDDLFAIVRFNWILTRRSVLTWGLSLGAYLGALTLMFHYFEKSFDFEKLIQQYPKEILDAFGIETFNTLASFLDAEYMGVFGPILVGIYALRTVIALIPNQEKEGTLAAAIASQPVRRSMILIGTGISTAICLAMVSLTSVVFILVCAFIAHAEIGIGALFAGFTGLWVLGFFVASVTALAVSIFKGSGIGIGVGSFLLGSAFILQVLIGINPDFAWLKPVSLLGYYDKPLLDGLKLVDHGGMFLCSVLLLIFGSFLYHRRDLVS